MRTPWPSERSGAPAAAVLDRVEQDLRTKARQRREVTAQLAGARSTAALLAALLTYLIIPPSYGLTIWGLDVYREYLPGMVAAGVLAGIGSVVGARSGVRVSMRPVPIVTVGLIVLALWLGFWFTVAPSLGRAA